jgi:hypothetical protein
MSPTESPSEAPRQGATQGPTATTISWWSSRTTLRLRAAEPPRLPGAAGDGTGGGRPGMDADDLREPRAGPHFSHRHYCLRRPLSPCRLTALLVETRGWLDKARLAKAHSDLRAAGHEFMPPSQASRLPLPGPCSSEDRTRARLAGRRLERRAEVEQVPRRPHHAAAVHQALDMTSAAQGDEQPTGRPRMVISMTRPASAWRSY